MDVAQPVPHSTGTLAAATPSSADPRLAQRRPALRSVSGQPNQRFPRHSDIACLRPAWTTALFRRMGKVPDPSHQYCKTAAAPPQCGTAGVWA